jgi:DNA polymerase (family 10)
VAGADEAEVYAALGLRWIPPELREDRGEIAAAERGELPRLVAVEDLRGDLQMHSTWSDGKASIEEMLVACAARGYEYFALTDHSKALPMIGGLDAHRLRAQWQEIAEVAARHPEIRLLRSMEVDILGDGSLDLEDELLAELDLVVVAVHSRFDLPPAEQTARILRAVAHPAVDVLAHPTGRRLGQRKPMDFDVGAVLAACREHGVAVEANASPARLDLADVHLARARELGVPVAISTDAHSVGGLDTMRYGVDQARRAGLGPGDVLNTRPLADLLAWLDRRTETARRVR